MTDVALQQQPPEVDADVLSWLEAEGLADVFDAGPEMRRADLDVWLDRRLEAIARLEQQQAENREVSQRRQKMIADHFDGLNASLERNAEWLRRTLAQVALAYPYPQGSKSRKLAFGEIGKRKQPARLEVVDPQTVLTFAGVYVPDAVKHEPKLVKDELNAWWTANGEPEVPGCIVHASIEKPYAKAKK